MRLKASPDEIVCSHPPHEERHLRIAISFDASITKYVTHSDLCSSDLALLVKCIDDSFDGVIEQVRGLFAGRYQISPADNLVQNQRKDTLTTSTLHV